jgi:hypothetical protein
MRFYQASRRSRVIQTGIFVLLVASVLFSFSHGRRYIALFLLLWAAIELHSVWNRYWEITPDERLLSRAYGFKHSYPAASVRYAGPAREVVGYPVSKNDIELVLEGLPTKRYVRVANRRGFIDELSRVSPQAEIVRF